MKEITEEENKRRRRHETFDQESAGNYEGNKRGGE
jgi:hypothetical protein